MPWKKPLRSRKSRESGMHTLLPARKKKKKNIHLLLLLPAPCTLGILGRTGRQKPPDCRNPYLPTYQP
eukprot:5033555-Prymnesium_polylepis.1